AGMQEWEAAGSPRVRVRQGVPPQRPASSLVGGIAVMPMPLLQKQVEQHPYPLIFATISGAHLYGFPSPDSDFDLRGAHVLPVKDMLGLEETLDTIQVSGERQGIELDLVMHDLRKFLELLLKPNGYVLEQLYSPLVVL